MSMDNRLFSVNGEGQEMLERTLALAFEQQGPNTAAKAYLVDPKKGMILLWYHDKGSTAFPAPLNPKQTAALVWAWLGTEPKIEQERWEKAYIGGDVWSEPGWRVYCEDWGHVGDNHYAIVAVKPVFLWAGK